MARYKIIDDNGIYFTTHTVVEWLDLFDYDNAKKYVAQLNASRFAGYSDWRLPTLEEAMSLMEPLALNRGLHVDPVFDGPQEWIWTSEKQTASSAWVVGFFYGICFIIHVGNDGYVRAVR